MTTTPVELLEWTESEPALSASDATFVAASFGRYLSVALHAGSGLYKVSATRFVGVVICPSGQEIRIYPKLPVGNLFYMLAVCEGMRRPFRDQVAQFGSYDEIFDFVAEYFCELVQFRIERGLDRRYLEVEDNLRVVRGRLEFAPDLRANFARRHMVFCRFTEFTWDIPENQILRQAAHHLAGWGLSAVTTMRLEQLDRELSEVSVTCHPTSIIDRFVYDRLNGDYRDLHSLARLLLDGFSVSEAKGGVGFRGFLLNMDTLFERFVGRTLDAYTPSNIRIDEQVSDYLDTASMLDIRPDILWSDGGRGLRLIVDAKYKRTVSDKYHHPDFYQITAYCTALGVATGVLVYPVAEWPIRDTLTIRPGQIAIHRVPFNLQGDLDLLKASCKSLAWEIGKLDLDLVSLVS